MAHPVRQILSSTASREANRLDLGLARGAILLFSFPAVLIPAATLLPATAIGPVLLRPVFVLSLLLMYFLAVRLGSDSVGDRRSGFLELISLAGLRPWQWLTVRTVQMWVAFLSVWIVRVPVLVIVFCFGGLRVWDILAVELLLLAGFWGGSNVSLLLAQRAKSRQVVASWTGGVVIPLELLLLIPRSLIGYLSGMLNWSFSGPVSRFAGELAQLSLAERFRSLMTGQFVPEDVWPTMALYGGLGAVAMLRLAAVLFRNPGDDRADAPDTWRELFQPVRPRSRPSRRCWDDALAWQAYAVHARGTGIVRGSWIWNVTIGGVVLVFVVAQPQYFEFLVLMLLASCCLKLLFHTAKPGDCLQREIREKTLPMLMLTPHEEVELYDGWRRGAWRLSVPDLALLGVAAIALLPMRPEFSIWMLAAGAAILSSGPFLMLSQLVPWTLRGIAAGFSVVFLLLGLTLVCTILGAALSTISFPLAPLLFPLVTLGLFYGFNQGLRKVTLPRWMREKVDSTL
jgi:hypothetical protein